MKKIFTPLIFPLTFLLGVGMILVSCGEKRNDTTSSIAFQKEIPEKVDFNFHVKPILSDRCFTCHGPDENTREANLAFHDQSLAMAALGKEKDHFAIIPGDAVNSTLIKRIYADNPDDIMPPSESNLTLNEYEKEVLKRWIEQGAEWKKHWAFIPPLSSQIPEVQNSTWPKNEIDYFILNELERNGLEPEERASKEKLVRRASFDLTGLPPTIDQIDLFLNDYSNDAFQKLIHRLMDTPAFAERMTIDWMDLARYADTNGYQDDFERFNWPWRDWVLHAFQKNMPYDDFVTWQLAGDLLPDASLEQILATGFNRNHKITNEGGVIPEEYRVEYVSDRTNTFATAFLGLTMECAKCHDHKYDPISQKNYYELFSFFNNVPENGFVPNGADPEPVITLTKKEVKEKLAFIRALDSTDIKYMVMKEMDEPRQAHILNRGAYDQPTTPVNPNAPEDILPFSSELPQNRLGLAQWLFSEEHPLTARILVNRLWQQFFGTGIVATTEDFGNQGSLPSHPELLDHLAIKVQEDGWDIRKMISYIMSSATYQQSARISSEKYVIDPQNILLARAPRLRLSAEMIRDHALEISELLVDQVGGPSVKPYQPAGLWKETTGGGGGSTALYVEDDGEGLYRRSLYTFWKRTVPPPSMMTFDAASRDLCTVKRQNTSTPLQALVLLNDPQIVEASRMLAFNAINTMKNSEEERLSYMFRRATSRIPNSSEIDELSHFLQSELQRFQENTDAAKEYVQVGNYKVEQVEGVTELAAYASVASLIMNLDETISRG